VKPYAAAMLMAALAFAGSTPLASAQENRVDSTPPDSYASFGTGDALLAQAVVLIAAATPSSLAEGIRLAAAADQIGADGAAGAGIVARDLVRGLYPNRQDLRPTRDSRGMKSRSEARSSSGWHRPWCSWTRRERWRMQRACAPGSCRLMPLFRNPPCRPSSRGCFWRSARARSADTRVQFEAALKRSPAFSPAAVGLARTIIASGAAPGELPLLQHLASLLPTESQRFAAFARGALAAGRPEKAADASAQGLLRSPDDPDFVILRARALAATGDWYQALWVLDALLRLQPDLTEAILLKARLLHENAQDDAQALAVLADAESRYPTDASFPGLRASILLDEKRTQEAVTALRHAYELAPDNLAFLSLLASTSAQSRQWNEASAWLAMIPAPARTAENLRVSWRISTGLGDHVQAKATALQLFQMTKNPDALALEARSMLAAGRRADARLVIDHVLGAMDPPPSQASELHFLHSQAGSDDPLFDLRTALKENPDNGEALAAITDVLAARKDYRKAMEYAKRASAMAPGNAALAQKAIELAKLADAAQ